MKKVILILLSAIFIQQASAQSFQKGSLVLAINYGIDVDKVAETYNLYNVPNSSQSTSTTAGSKNWNLDAEYGVLKWLGLGIHLKLDNYYTSKDSSGYTPTAYGFEGGILVNIHIIRAKHFDLVIGGNIGFSSFTYTYDVFSDQVYGNGSYTDLHISPRFYFGRFGINANIFVPHYKYNSLTSNNGTFGDQILASWNANGGGATIGIQYRILN